MEEQGETRKIQFTGKSSYIVSLPKQWISELGLKQGDQVRMVRKGSSTLEVFPPKFESRKQKKEDATIEISEDEKADAIVRKLISLYFLGFRTINLKSKNGRLNPSQRNTVKEAVKRMLMGSEIISDSSNGITIQVLVNLLELSVDGAFKRMIHLAKSMSNDAILAVKENNMDLAEEVINTDDEVDRFGFYIIRQLKIAIQNEHFLKEMGFRTFNNYFEEAYDLDMDPDVRINTIVDVCDRLRDAPWQDIYLQSQALRKHNHDKFFHRENLSNEINRTINLFFEFADGS